MLRTCLPASITPNPTLHPLWLAALWGRWKECMPASVSECLGTLCLCVLFKFSCVIPEAPLTPSQVFLFLRRVFIIIYFFSNRWILDSVGFHIENRKHSTNMMESLFQGALTLLFPFFLTQYPLILHIRVEYHLCGHARKRMP